MKKIILLFVAMNISCASKAQTFDLYNNPNYGHTTNAYYKDLENFQNQFEGTWIYQNGQERLEIKFRKKEMVLSNPGQYQYYDDVLIGEYKYVNQNGIEKVNSLVNLNVEHNSAFNYSIYSGAKVGNHVFPVCNDCPSDSQRLIMYFDEPENDDFTLKGKLAVRHVVEEGVEKLKIQFVNLNEASNENKLDLGLPSIYREFSLPYGSYTLIKQ